MDRLKILVVDDEARMRKLVKDFLVKNEYDVVEAEDGSVALDLFYADKSIALIILDVMMPQMDGCQCFAYCHRYLTSYRNPFEDPAAYIIFLF